MSLSSIELWQRLAAEGLASPMQCRSWAGEVSKALPAAETADGLKVLQQLIDLGKLTKYQAKALAGQSTDPLKRGPWHVLQKVKHPLWQGWLEITRIDTSKGEQPPPKWARWLTANDLNSLLSSAPSLPRGIQLANIRAQHLQTIEMPEMVDGELQLQVHPVQGKSLAELYAKNLVSPAIALTIVQQTAAALSAMHEKKVVHGRVTPDRIFWDDSQGVTLVRDPISVWTTGVDPNTTGILGEQLPGLHAASFLAPEFLAPKQPPSLVSDMYSLGATWWWLLIGKPPAEGKSIGATLGMAAETNLNFIDKLKDLPAPIRVCLEHCLAKNPSARFANAIQLCQALAAASRSLAKGMVVQASLPTQNATIASPTSLAPTRPTSPTTNSKSSSNSSTEVRPKSNQASPPVPAPSASSPSASSVGKSMPVEKPSTTKKISQPITSLPTAPVVTESTNSVSLSPCVMEPPGEVAKPILVAEVIRAESKATPTLQPEVTTDLNFAQAQRPDQPSPITAAQRPTPLVAASNSAANSNATSKPTARRRAKRRSKMPLYVIAGFGFLAMLLGILKFSGALDSKDGGQATKNDPYKPPVVTVEPKVVTNKKDPLLEQFRIVESKDALWAPPVPVDPVVLDLLPPGAQLYLVLRPAEILSNKNSKALVEVLQKQFQLDQLLGMISSGSGQPIESIASIVVAYYTGSSPEQFPQYAWRVELIQGQTLEQLKSAWKTSSEAVVGQERLHLSDDDQAFFVPNDALKNTIQHFSCGPASLMKEAAELGGAAAPLSSHFKLLQSKTSRTNQIAIMGSPRFLYTDGRGLMKRLPTRMQNIVEPIMSKEARGALIQLQLLDRCYWELQLIGATDADTPRLISKLSDRAAGAASEIESWFVSQTPHPYWRVLAFRFPQMIRTWREYARFGIEDGIGLANGYLPSEAATNLIVASWIATQEASTMAGQLTQPSATPTDSPALTPEDILNRSIRLSFDQEPIERALALVGEEANSGVPAASQLRFELDGGAFERAGITRNQQLRDFKIDNQPAREALTNIAKRGNPVTTVKDTRELDQRLIWVVKEDSQNQGKKMISLTTRDAATAAGIALPVEFAPQ